MNVYRAFTNAGLYYRANGYKTVFHYRLGGTNLCILTQPSFL